ncbi:hypothetical protein AVEN_158807-1 [Araneus ventricosus]|uniref:Uncharacterized protein n=1 Tax=Araneus ventricosus TaxID=182803 RepID=A0A4Y2HUN9_ARAVE|nr:hypothetical protein AVEN_158807-1 [Araneus ventricosus]
MKQAYVTSLRRTLTQFQRFLSLDYPVVPSVYWANALSNAWVLSWGKERRKRGHVLLVSLISLFHFRCSVRETRAEEQRKNNLTGVQFLLGTACIKYKRFES